MAAKALTLKEFASLQSWAPSYVTKLKNAGRLVFSQAGRVKVRESLALIEQTAGNRGDVAARHQAAREAVAPAPAAKKTEVDAPAPKGQEKRDSKRGAKDDHDADGMKVALREKALAESRRVIALADREEMERDRMAGELIAREDVDASMKFIGATIRALLDVLPDQLAPLVATVTDLDECHALISEECRNVLVRFGEAIEKQKAAMEAAQNG